MPLALGELIKEQDTVVGSRPLPRRGHLAAADQPHIGFVVPYSTPMMIIPD
jgi:hypothetical protein